MARSQEPSSSGSTRTTRGRRSTINSPHTPATPPSRSSLSRQSSRNVQDLSDSESHSSSRHATPRNTGRRRVKVDTPEVEDRDGEGLIDSEPDSGTSTRKGQSRGQGQLRSRVRPSSGRRNASRSKITRSTHENEDDEDEDDDDNDNDDEQSTRVETGDEDEDQENLKRGKGGDDGKNSETKDVIDEIGETKITKDGELLGGRQFRCRTFKLPERGDTIFMLSMDLARILGFRDSYLFFMKNPQLKRVITTIEERTWMIQEGILLANFKSKLIALVPARDIFMQFGHRIIKNGRSKVDDYYGGTLAGDEPMEMYDRENSTMRDDGSVGAGGDENVISAYRRKRGLDQTDGSIRPATNRSWMYESALAVRELNAQLAARRKEHPRFSDAHTNLEQIAAAFQPSKCAVSVVPETVSKKQDVGTLSSEDKATKQNPNTPIVSKVIAIPRSIGPRVDETIKIDIKPAVPAPPTINDPEIWAVIPEDVKKALTQAQEAIPKETDDPDLYKYPVALMPGHHQATYPVHQVRFKRPFRIVLPQSMMPNAQLIHQQWTAQGFGAPLEEKSSYPGHISAEELRLLQAHQEELQRQQKQQQLEREEAEKQLLAAAAQQAQAAPANQSIFCGAPLKTGLGYCQRLVSTQGEHCPNHRGSTQSQPGTPRANGSSNIKGVCGECHSTTADVSDRPDIKALPCSPTHLNQCKTCSKDFHPLCIQLDTPRTIAAIASYPWQCNDCKLCVVCLEAGDEATLLICDDCDRGWHMGCCDPVIKDLPKGINKFVALYDSLLHDVMYEGTESPTTEYHHAILEPTAKVKHPTFVCTYCTKCFDNFKKERFCPVCLRTYKGDNAGNEEEEEEEEESGNEDDDNMVCCDECNRWVHMECDGQLTEAKVEEMGKDESLKYSCPLCLNRTTVLAPGTGGASDDMNPNEALLSLRGVAPVQARACGVLGDTKTIRGLAEHRGKMLGVPVIVGSGVEYDRRLVTKLLEQRASKGSKRRRQKEQKQAKTQPHSLQLQSQSHSQPQYQRQRRSVTAAAAAAVTSRPSATLRSKNKSRSPIKRRVSLASSTSSLSSVSNISDN
ncbi:hypothetical protein BGZ94_000389 [Podila epigama]|nr:hypothetical protein BGZ94_000389 [Podila epigama]